MFVRLIALLVWTAVSVAAEKPSLSAVHHAWQVRDAKADSEFAGPDPKGNVSAQQVKLFAKENRVQGVRRFSCRLLDTSGTERAVTLAFAMDVDAAGWTWWDDPERKRVIAGGAPLQNIVDWYHAEPVFASYYPLAVISNAERAICLAVPLEPPRMARFLYDPNAKEFRAEFDFGLSPVLRHFPSSAEATVLVYEAPAAWAFRQALARYYELFPKAFVRRVKTGGIWIPFQSLGALERPEDFQIAFREVAYGDWDSIKFDEQVGAKSFVYVEPQTNWRELRGDAPRSYDAFLEQLKQDADAGDGKAQATLVSGIEREDGRYDLYLDPIAWTRQAPFGVNPDPEVSTSAHNGWPNKGQYELKLLEDALGWRGGASRGLDGVYVDSMEGWGALRNYRKAHWETSRYPLTFHHQTKRACLMNFWGTYAFVKELSARLHEHDMIVFGNGAYHRFWQLAPFLDIGGMEYNWYADGKWAPVPDWQFLYLRAMSAQRPYVLLMNSAFDDSAHMEEYFQRCLFYACYPSMFHAHTGSSRPYFSNPEWYNRDRHLFVKYLPLIRKLDLAGWEPMPYATAEPDGIRIERYGDGRTNDLAFTVHNPTNQPAEVALT